MNGFFYCFSCLETWTHPLSVWDDHTWPQEREVIIDTHLATYPTCLEEMNLLRALSTLEDIA